MIHDRLAVASTAIALVMGSAGAVAAADCKPVTDADMMGMAPGANPQQYDLIEFETAGDCTLTFSGNPEMDALNAEIAGNGNLPAVADRLPSEPLVLIPNQNVGTYGGTMNALAKAPESGTSDMLSWRHVNLVRFSDDLQTIVPSVAKSFTWNETGTEVTFDLRAGHKWSDGAPFTAQDIVFWYDSNKLNTELYSEVQSNWVFGGEPMKVEALSDTKVKFSFAVPNPNFLTFLATTWKQPFLPKHFLAQFHGDFNENADALAKERGFDTWVEHFQFLACGSDWKDCPTPLMRDSNAVTIPTLESFITTVENQTERTYVANPYFFMVDTAGNQLPYPSRWKETWTRDREIINLKAIQGEFDLKASGLELVDYPLLIDNMERGDYKVSLASTGAGSHMTYTMNFGHKDEVLREVLNDVTFRQALSLAINRAEVNELVYLGQGKPAQWLPADHNSHSLVTESDMQHMAAFDPDKANEMLDSIGLTEKDAEGIRLLSDGRPLVLRLDFPAQAGPAEVHELVRDYWSAVGVRLELKEVSTEVFRAQAEGSNHDIAVWGGGGTDAVGVVSGLSNTRMAPPFREGHAVEWQKWLQSDGAEGVEPTEDAKRVYEVVEDLYFSPIGSDKHQKLVREMVDLHKDNTWLIGIVGDVPDPLLVRNRVGNVMAETSDFVAFSFYRHHAYKAYQWYLKDGK
ncbi:ABC transporter substrate-binding protein [Shimia sp. R10_1]|uniref:ABC transporter substrate-binding protein n=1 Tax=Shimia sp. R10_1 TaxID=2821095 RepID=UPI001ADA729A|nr:ABC transporter substrate-binding protein [Shimia sp. R10_1]MBO9474807.1 ABC transporter substrate-binding protein [Shimia sp. R10_1]